MWICSNTIFYTSRIVKCRERDGSITKNEDAVTEEVQDSTGTHKREGGLVTNNERFLEAVTRVG